VRETGYWFGNKAVAPSWTRGVVAGHEFRRDTELYMEFYDETDTGTVAGVPKLNWSTLGIGGRPADHQRTLNPAAGDVWPRHCDSHSSE